MATTGEHSLDHSIKIEASEIPALMRRHGLYADKRLGQVFLVDPASLQKVVSAAALSHEDWVLEIGAGLGNLTCLLAAQSAFVVAVELDERFIPILREVLKEFSNVKIIQGDILSLKPSELFSAQLSEEQSYTVVANIPYYITSAVIRHLLENRPRPQKIILTVQREVAERICAEPGDLSILALSVQVYGKPQIVARLPAGAFFPVPKVDSAIVRIDVYPEPLIAAEHLEIFFKLIKAGFSQKRKTLRNALAGSLGLSPQQVEAFLENVNLDPKQRAETLSLEDWNRITTAYRAIQT